MAGTVLAFQEDRSSIGFHAGGMLEMVSATYPLLQDFLLEQVQNALDAEASLIRMTVDLKRSLLVNTDNGRGVSRVKFEQALSQIGATVKDKGKLGRFGRGLISPLGKCKEFTFTSCPMRLTGDQAGYLQWTFNRKAICSKGDFDGIPVVERPELNFCRTGKGPRSRQNVAWRTQVRVVGITEDRYITRLNLNDLVAAIIDRFNTVMRKQGTVIEIRYTDREGKQDVREVRAQDFEGRQLPSVILHGEKCGRVIANLYLAPQVRGRKRKPKVLFGELGDDFRLNTTGFWQSLAALLKPDRPEWIDALQSGIFTGEILGEKIRLHANRKKFETNEALADFCACLQTWFDKHGRQYIDEVRTKQKETRYQELGIRTMRVVEAAIEKLEDWTDILDQLAKFGTTGIGHVDGPRIGKQDEKTKATRGGAGKKRPDHQPDTRDRSDPETEQENHRPTTVAGPTGTNRNIVKGDSTGLQFQYMDMFPRIVPFEFDPRRGILSFNISHRHWFDCEVNDTALMKYQETVAFIALTLLRFVDTEQYHLLETMLADQLKLQVFGILNSDVLSGRRHGKFAPKAKATEESVTN
jgi:hypothetical protein